MVKELFEPLSESLTETAWSMLAGAFTGQAAVIGEGQWGVAVAFTNKMVVVMTVFTVLVGLFQVLKKLFQGRPRDAVMPAILAAIAWPVTAGAVWATVMATAATDKLVVAMIGTTSSDSLGKLFEAATKMGSIGGATNLDGGAASALGANLLMLLILWIFSLVLSMVMIFRNFALVVLVAFSPMALMLIPADTTRVWAKRWAETVVALILTKPIAAGFVVIAAQLVDSVDGMASALMALVGLIVACASPLAAIGLVKFTGANVGADAGADASSGTMRGGAKAGRGAMRAGGSMGRMLKR